MNTPIEIQDLVTAVVHQHPYAQIELDPLPSGVCFLWVSLAGRQFVMEYHPQQGAGVSENLPETPPFVGHDQSFDHLSAAVSHFLALLSTAAPATLALNHR